MFKFLHAADLHLDSPLRGLERYEGAPIDRIRGATRRALENLVCLAIAETVRFVVIAGDLYDMDWKDYNTALFFARQMRLLRDAGVEVYLVAGNHDAAAQITRNLSSMPGNVRYLSTRHPETVLLEDIGVAIHGQGFAERAVREDLSAGYPPARRDFFNIGLLHTAANGREGHEPYAPCTVEGLLSKEYDYWALGHVHRREILHENPWMIFPGNIQGRHVNESGAKGCTLVTVENGSALIEHRDLHVVEWAVCDIDASGAGSPEAVLEAARQDLGQRLDAAGDRLLAARIQLGGATDAHGELMCDPEKWTSELRSCGADLGGDRIWIEKVRIQTRAQQTGFEERLAQNDAVADLLRIIRKSEPNPEMLEAIINELSPLRAKLPREMADEVDALNLNAPETAARVLEDVKEILFSRLTSIGGAQ